MEGLAASIDKAADAVLLGFRNMLAVEFFEPSRHATGRLFVVQTSPNDIPEVHFPAGHPAQPRVWVEVVQDAFQTLRLFLRNQVALVDDDDVGKLNLIGQQIHNGSFVFFVAPICRS